MNGANIYLCYTLLAFELFGPDFFFFQNTPIFLDLSRDRIKGQQSKNISLTPTKTLLTK